MTAGKILRRCDSCGGFHASYLVVDPETGKREILCQSCWKKRFGAPSKQGEAQKPPARPPEDDDQG
jgi:hypothetical protein